LIWINDPTSGPATIRQSTPVQMEANMRKTLLTLTAVASIVAATVAVPTKAQAGCRNCWWVGGAVAAGLVGGAILANRHYYGYPRYGYYGYYGYYEPAYYPRYYYPRAYRYHYAPVYYGGYYPRYGYGYYGRRAYYSGGYYGRRYPYRRVYW
jgi:hypothetical protein